MPETVKISHRSYHKKSSSSPIFLTASTRYDETSMVKIVVLTIFHIFMMQSRTFLQFFISFFHVLGVNAVKSQARLMLKMPEIGWSPRNNTKRQLKMLHTSGSVRIGNLDSWGVFSKLTRVPADWTTLFGKEVSGVGVKVLVFFIYFLLIRKIIIVFKKQLESVSIANHT